MIFGGVDPWRLLAHDGAQRAEVRAITRSILIDYSGASWAEWLTLAAVAETCERLTA